MRYGLQEKKNKQQNKMNYTEDIQEEVFAYYRYISNKIKKHPAWTPYCPSSHLCTWRSNTLPTYLPKYKRWKWKLNIMSRKSSLFLWRSFNYFPYISNRAVFKIILKANRFQFCVRLKRKQTKKANCLDSIIWVSSFSTCFKTQCWAHYSKV